MAREKGLNLGGEVPGYRQNRPTRSYSSAWLGLLAALLLATIPGAAFAQTPELKSWDTIVTLETDSTTWEITIEYKSEVPRDDVWVLGRIDTFEAFVDGNPTSCELRQELGSAILCDVAGTHYRYVFTTEALATNLGNYLNFRYNFAATRIADRFTVTVKLPLGAALVETERLTGTGLRPFEPGFGQQETDGRRILVTWDLVTPKLGDTIPVSIVYEQFVPLTAEQLPLVIAGAAVVVAGAVFLLWRRRGAAGAAPPTWKLNKEERHVLHTIASHGKIEQAELVRELRLNKVKVSRMVSRLEDLGFVKAARIGRKNLLSTTQKAVEADWLVHLNELKERVVKPWVEDLDEWNGEGERPPLALGLSPKVKKQLFADMPNHFPSLMTEWKRLWKEYTAYSRAWGRARQALQAALVRNGKVVSPEHITKMVREIGAGKPPADMQLTREIKTGAKSLAVKERRLAGRIQRFRENLEKLEHYTKLPGSCEYIG